MTSIARFLLLLVAMVVTGVAGLTVLSMPGCGAKVRSETTKGGTHAAAWEKPRGAKYALSQHSKLSRFGAHSGTVSDEFCGAEGGAETSALMPDARSKRAVWRSLVAHRGIRNYSGVARSNRVAAPHPTQLSNRVVSSAQQQESAARPASVALRVTGSAAAQPGSIRVAGGMQ